MPAFSLTPAIHQALVAAARRGVPPQVACLAAGIPRETVASWNHVALNGTWPSGDPAAESVKIAVAALAGDLAVAQAECEAEMVQNIEKAGYRELKSGGVDWRAHLDLLKHHSAYRERWREHREVSVWHRGQVAHEHRIVRELDAGQLTVLAVDVAPELAGLLPPGVDSPGAPLPDPKSHPA